MGIFMLIKWLQVLCFTFNYCARNLSSSAQTMLNLVTLGFKFPDPFANASGSTHALESGFRRPRDARPGVSRGGVF